MIEENYFSFLLYVVAIEYYRDIREQLTFCQLEFFYVEYLKY